MKKGLFVIFCFVLGALVFEAKNTYSLFETDSTVGVSSELANWSVRINNNSITNLDVSNNSIDLGEIVWESQNHVVEGKAAPGSTGKFNILIDPTDTEVSFIYELTIDLEVLNNSEFSVDYIKEINDYNLVRIDKNTYAGLITLAEINRGIKHNIEVGIKWYNNEENNRSDYELGIDASALINVPISISVYQYTGDVLLVEYVEDSEANEISG